MLNTHPNGEEDKTEENEIHFDGFVNVNDIVKKRRMVREANFTNDDIDAQQKNIEDNY